MASHFSTLGLSVNSEQELWDLARQVGGLAEDLPASGGTYLRWSDPSGVELWLQVEGTNELVGLNPHFRGKSVVRVGLTARIDSNSPSKLDGAFHGWAEPADDSPDSGCYPFVFDAPDFRRHDRLVLPVTAEVQIAAFAHEIKAFPSEEAHGASQSGELKFASRSFIPAGLFSSAEGDSTPPTAQAILTGHVLESERKSNSLTGRPFHWALVETLGGRFDVVIDPDLLPELPQAGGVLSGSFWLTGRVLAG